MRDTTPLDVAISGGGHRASVWGLGALLYLRDVGGNEDVRTIASVSGGSLTNAVVALSDPYDDPSVDTGPLVDWARQLAGSVAAFWIALSGVLALPALGVLVFGLDLGPGRVWWVPVVAVAASILWGGLIGPRSRGSFWAWWGTWAYVAVIVTLTIDVAAIWWLPWHWSYRLLLFVPALVVVVMLAGMRNLIADRAFAATVCRRGGRVAKLTDMNAEPQHVICATELHGPHHTYFSKEFIWSWDFGLGSAVGTRVATSAQASSNLPGAFPVRWLATGSFSFILENPESRPNRQLSRLALTDGGVYDNMGEQWADGLDRRLRNIRRTRLGPKAEVVESVRAEQGRIRVRDSDWFALSASRPSCGAAAVPVKAEGEGTSTVLVQAVADGSPIAPGTGVRIAERRGEAVLVADDYDAMHARTAVLEPHRAHDDARLVVVNASAGRQLSRLKRSRIPGFGEAQALMSVLGALYDNGTSVRRRDLVGRWRARSNLEDLRDEYGFELRDTFLEGSDSGYLVQIDRNPFAFAAAWSRGSSPEAARARAALEYLPRLGPDRQKWECIAMENAKLATTFKPLGARSTANLLFHSYVLTMIGMHVLYDYDLVTDEASLPTLATFQGIAVG